MFKGGKKDGMYVEDRCIPSLNPCFHRVALPLPYMPTVSESRATLVQFLQQLTCLRSLRERRRSESLLVPYTDFQPVFLVFNPLSEVPTSSYNSWAIQGCYMDELTLSFSFCQFSVCSSVSQYSSTCYLPKSCWYLIFPYLLCPLVLFLFANYYNLTGFGERMQIKHWFNFHYNSLG